MKYIAAIFFLVLWELFLAGVLLKDLASSLWATAHNGKTAGDQTEGEL